MRKLMLLIVVAVMLATAVHAQEAPDLDMFPYAKGAINGTYFLFEPQAAFIGLHAGIGGKSTAIFMFGSTGLIGIAARHVAIGGREGVYIDNYKVVIGEPNSGGPGLRSLAVLNDPQRFSEDGRPID
jgi:hypothetical protein